MLICLLLTWLIPIEANARGIDLDRFKLSAPTIVDVEEDAAFLIAGDFDADGRKDFAVFDRKKNLLRVCLRRDKENEPFEKRLIVVEQVVTGMDTGDLDGDGTDDILLGADPPAVLYLKKNGKLEPPEELDLEGAYATAADLNGDGRLDVVTAKDRDIRVALQSKDGNLDKPRIYRSVLKVAMSPDIKDIDGDGRADMVYPDPSSRENVVFRFQDARGEFGQERILRLGAYSWAQPSSKLGNGKPGFGVADSQTGVLKIAQLAPEKKSVTPILSEPRLYAFDVERPTGRESLVVGELNHSAQSTIALVSPEKAEAFLYNAEKDGTLSRRSAPALQGVTEAQIVSSKEGGQLWILSPSEEALAIMTAQGKGEKGGLAFPRLLSFGVKPMAFAAGAFGGRADDTDLVVGYRPKTDESEADLELAFYHDLSNPNAALAAASTMTLTDTKSAELLALLAADLNNDGLTDLVCFFDYNPLRILLQKREGAFEPLEVEKSVGAGMFNQVTATRIRVADVTDDGKNEILIARPGFARCLSISQESAISVVDQYNGRNAKSDIGAAVVANLDGGKRAQIVLLDTGNSCLTIYGANAEGRFELLRNEDLVGIVPRDVIARDLNGDGKDDLLLVGNDRFGVIYGGVADPEFKVVQTAIADVEDGKYSMVDVGDFNDDGVDEIVALEETENLLDFFQLAPDAALKRFYRFKVFEGVSRSAMPRQPGPPEPRELVVTDFNKDGRPDLLALCHREVLVYLSQDRPQEKK